MSASALGEKSTTLRAAASPRSSRSRGASWSIVAKAQTVFAKAWIENLAACVQATAESVS